MRIHPLITMVIMSITYYKMVGMDMEFCYHANFTKWFHSKEQWNCQNGQNGKWSTELIYYSLRPESTRNFRVHANTSMEYGLEMKSYENKTIHVLYHLCIMTQINININIFGKKAKISNSKWLCSCSGVQR